MVDMDAIYNFIFKGEARKLGPKLRNDSSHMKTVNFKVFTITRMAKQVSVKLGLWWGKLDFVVVQIDEFNVVLEIEFHTMLY